MIKRTMGFAVVAIAAGVVAVPAASAAWTDGTVSVGAYANVSFAGNFAIVGAFGGTSCHEGSATGTLEPGTTGTITSFAPAVESCTTSGGLAGCTVTSVTSTNLPWTMHANGSNVTVTGFDLDITYHSAFCPYHELTLGGSFIFDLNNVHQGQTWTITGTVELRNGTTGAFIQNVTPSGTLSIAPSSTYGIT